MEQPTETKTRKGRTTWIIVGLVIVGIVLGVLAAREQSAPSTLQGRVQTIDAAARSLTIDATPLGERIITLSAETTLLDESGDPIELPYLRTGFEVQAEGTMTDDVTLAATAVRVIRMPNIILLSPTANGEASLPLRVTGEARVFEGQLHVRLTDEDGTVLVEQPIMTTGPDQGAYGPFSADLTYPAPKGVAGTLEAFAYSAEDGSEIDAVWVPLRFAPSTDTMAVNVFFGSKQEDLEGIRCNGAYPTPRRILKTAAMGRAALEELLKGPTRAETENGFFTAMNDGVTLVGLTITEGVARAEFDSALEEGVGGSCRVAMIRAQIAATLKQFPTVTNVVIAINGRTEDILQP